MTTLPTLYDDEQLDSINENLRLIRKKDGLTFGTDSYLLAAYVRSMPGAAAVDLGSGTGVLPLLLLSKNKIRHATAVEVQETFYDLILRNAALGGFSEQITPLCADVRDLPLAAESADIVLSNPPYMKPDSGFPNKHDIKFIARHEVMGDIADFCRAAARLLKFGGLFYVVYRPDRMVDLVAALRACGLEPKRMTMVQATAASTPSMLLMEAKKGAAPSLTLTRPLILKAPSGDMSEDCARIYETCSFADFLK